MKSRTRFARECVPWIVLWLALLPCPAASATGSVQGPSGQVLRTRAAAGWLDSAPRPSGDCSGTGQLPVNGVVRRESAGNGYTIDACGGVHGVSPLRAATGPTTRLGDGGATTNASSATIDSMSFAWSGDASPDAPTLNMPVFAGTYYLSDGTTWQSGAGTAYTSSAMLQSVEVSGTTVRYYFSPPQDQRLYEQTDYDFGDHSSQGRLGVSDPLLLEAEIGSTHAVLKGNATIVSNDATYYGDRFNYFGAPVGAIVPFEIDYDLAGATWTPDTFKSAFSYGIGGMVRFTLPPLASPLAGLRITGPAQVTGEGTFRYRAVGRFEGSYLQDVTGAAAWSVDPAALATLDGGMLTTLPLSAPEATLNLHATYAVGGVSRDASFAVQYRQAPPEDPGTDWRMFQANSHHTGYRAVDLHAADFQWKWQQDLAPGATLNPVTSTGGEVFCSRVLYFDTVPSLWALNARTGQILWSKGFGSVYSVNPPSCNAGKVYVQTCNNAGDTWLHALDAATGATVFKAPHGAQWERYFAPTLFDGKVYVDGGVYGGMYAFDGTSGQQLWFTYLEQFDQWTPAVDEQFAYAYVDGRVHVVDRLSGRMDHSINDPGYQWNGYDMNVAAVLGQSSDLFVVDRGRLLSFDVTGSEIRWQQTSAFRGQPSLAGAEVFTVDGGRLRVLGEGAGNDLWGWTPPNADLSSNIVVTRTHVFVASADHVYAVDRGTHTLAWSYAAGGQIALADGMLFVASASGRLTGIQVAPPFVLRANAGQDIVAECASAGGAGTLVRLDGTGTVGEGVTYAWSAPGISFDDPTSATPSARFPLGQTQVALVVSAQGQSASDSVQVEVRDTTPPAITVASETAVLWPPDHRLVNVRFDVQALDGCDGAPAVKLVSVSSNEPDAGSLGDGVTNDEPGANVAGSGLDVALRAERAGDGRGRTYTVCFEARDASGNAASGCAEVVVPHDQRGDGRLAQTARGWKVTLYDSPLLPARELDPATLRVVQPGVPDLRWQGTGTTYADVNGDGRADVTLDLATTTSGSTRAPASAPSGPAYALWTARDGVCATPLAMNATTGAGDLPAAALSFSATLRENPGRSSAEVRYTLPTSGHVRFSVWDVSGRLVARLVDREEAAGEHQVTFAPRQRRGNQVYFYRVEWGGETRVGRFVLID